MTTATTDSPAAALRSLVIRAAEPNLIAAERAAKARTAGSELADLRDLARTGAMLPDPVMDAIKAYRGDAAAEERLAARGIINEARAVAIDVPADMAALIANGGIAPGLSTGLGDGLPLIRQIADLWPLSRTGQPLIPAAPTGPLVGDIVTPGAAPAGNTTITINDVATPPRWDTAATIAEISNQVFDWSDDDGRYLAELIDDMTDRAAETNISAKLVAAGTNAAAGSDLPAAIDNAESLAGAALLAPADLVLANPADLPKVRRAVNTSWQTDPHPTLFASMGVPAGKVIVTGRKAFVLLARPNTHGADRALDDDGILGPSTINDARSMSVVRPAGWSIAVAVMRDHMLVVRTPAAVRVITL